MVFVLLFVWAANAQTKSVTGTVINIDSGASGRFEILTIKVGSKEYSTYKFSANGQKAYNPKVVGNIDVGTTVRVYYTKVVNGELKATRIVEIRKSRN